MNSYIAPVDSDHSGSATEVSTAYRFRVGSAPFRAPTAASSTSHLAGAGGLSLPRDSWVRGGVASDDHDGDRDGDTEYDTDVESSDAYRNLGVSIYPDSMPSSPLTTMPRLHVGVPTIAIENEFEK